MIKKLNHRLIRLIDRRDELLKLHQGNETKFTYWGGFELGYVKGQIKEIEDIIDFLNE